MPDPNNEPPHEGSAGAGDEFEPRTGAFADETELTREEIERRRRNTSTRRKPMGPAPSDTRRSGAFAEDPPPAPDVSETPPPR
jgi:hypothetical protein